MVRSEATWCLELNSIHSCLPAYSTGIINDYALSSGSLGRRTYFEASPVCVQSWPTTWRCTQAQVRFLRFQACSPQRVRAAPTLQVIMSVSLRFDFSLQLAKTILDSLPTYAALHARAYSKVLYKSRNMCAIFSTFRAGFCTRQVYSQDRLTCSSR